MEKIHLHLLDIIVVFDRICKEEKLTYYLFAGTLLGAVRHKGFIPWDDDADVAMPRKDFEKLKTVAKKYLPKYMYVQCYETDSNEYNMYMRIQSKKDIYEAAYERDVYNGQFFGASVDIFPLDNAHKEHSVGNSWRAFCKKNLETFALRSGKHNTCVRGDKKLKQKLANLIAHTLSRRKWCTLRDKMVRGGYNDSEPYYINLGSWHYSYKDQVFLKSKIDPPIQMEFEGKMLSVPKDTDYVLRKFYGNNYMQIPPAKKRRVHFKHTMHGEETQ